MNAERRAQLEEQRRFLLDSIRDLDQQRAHGDVDPTEHATLRDGYVVRAAAVLREIESGGPEAAPGTAPPRRWLPVVVATIVVGVGLGLTVSRFAGERLPSQSLTGRTDRLSGLLSQGRSLLATDPAGAIDAYRKVLEIEPDNAEARTYTAWILVLDGQAGGDQARIIEAMQVLREAQVLDDTYADPHCLLAVAAARFLDPADQTTVVAEVEACLARNPPADMVPMIEALLAD